MKANLLFLSFVLLLANNSFSKTPTPQKSQMAKKKDSVPPVLYEKTVFTQAKLVPASEVSTKPKPEQLEVKNNNLATNYQATAEKNHVVPVSGPTGSASPNYSKATLLDAFVTVSTGFSAQTFPVTSGENKDPDTHWSCGIFDQNGRPITSFHDDSNNDEYAQGSITGPLQMHIDNSAVFGDFANGGRIHINIAPNGNDTWGITNFVLAIDFQNPSISQRIAWSSGFEMTQDKRDIDLYFKYDGKNLVVRQ
jgi:hypothetical protein